mmetsp:Transcript_21737/g.64773  ORF Transcript_21737/g.64773 Transcript_21737/m.64773 type:complete len:203 (+) Transcript_21737:1443-2051(+)
MSGAAWLLMSSCAVVRCPSRAASWSGVSPSKSASLMSAFAETSSCTAPRTPERAAICSAVLPPAPLVLSEDLAATSSCATRSASRAAELRATWSAVSPLASACSTEALAFSRTSQTPWLPSAAQTCSGVWPKSSSLLSLNLSVALALPTSSLLTADVRAWTPPPPPAAPQALPMARGQPRRRLARPRAGASSPGAPCRGGHA